MTLHSSSVVEWWRPDAPAAVAAEFRAEGETLDAGGRLAFAALVTFTMILFVAPQERIPALAALRIAALSAVTAFVSYWVDRVAAARPAPPRSREVRLVFLLVAWAVVTVPFSLWPGGSVATLSEYLKSILVFWLLGATLLTLPRLRLMAWTLTLASLPLAATAILNFAAGAYDEGRVVGYQSGIAQNPNDLALTLNIVLPITAALFWSARRPAIRIALAGMMAMNTIGVIVTFSRGGFLTLVAIFVFTTLALLRSRAVLVWAASLLLLVLAVPFLPAGYGDRLSTIANVEADPTGSAQDRWRDIVAATRLVIAHPIVGAGAGQDVLALNEIRGASWKNVHNIYLEYGVDLGLPGMALFLAVLVSAIRGARRVETAGRDDDNRDARELSQLAGGVRVGLIAFGVAGFFHPVAYYFYFYYLAGLAVAVQRAAKVSA